MAIFRIYASIAINDSRQDGRSKFQAEIERLCESLGAARAHEPVLFLIDEV